MPDATRSEAEKWQRRKRWSCSQCGSPTGWAHTDPRGEGSTCNLCRRTAFDHGTRKGYREMKCRCHRCSQWASLSSKQYRTKRKDEGRPLPGGSGPWISPAVRLSVFERDEWTCQLCKGPVDREAEPQSDWYPSLDHIVPQSKGGSHDPSNLRTAHRWCNSIRGSEDHHAYLFEEAS